MPDEEQLIAKLALLSDTAAFNRWLRLEIVSASTGGAELRMRWRDEFAQYNGFLHASIVAGLIDTACGFAASTMTDKVLASQLSVRFLRPAKAEMFHVRGHVTKPGRLQIFAAAELFDPAAPDKPFAAGDTLLVPVS